MKNKIKSLLVVLAISISFVFCGGDAYADLSSQTASLDKIKTEFATKAPYGKRQLAMKFLLAMLGVVTSSVVIYVGLSLYNKFMYGDKKVVVNEDDNDFKTPTNMKDAINIFLKKTK